MTRSYMTINHNVWIPKAATLFVLIITAASFLLSYTNLVYAAIISGIPPMLAPAFPICLDAFLLVGSLTIVRASLRQESTLPGWIVLIVFTAVSVGFNVSVAPEGWLPVASHAVPPISMAISLELLASFIRSDMGQPVKRKRRSTNDPRPTMQSDEDPV